MERLKHEATEILIIHFHVFPRKNTIGANVFLNMWDGGVSPWERRLQKKQQGVEQKQYEEELAEAGVPVSGFDFFVKAHQKFPRSQVANDAI